MAILYYSPGACSLAPHIALRETGAGFDLVKVDLKAKQTEDGQDYWSINPKGQVPALKVSGGAILTENAVVLQYIADQAPDAGLMPPAGGFDRFRALEWLNYVAGELHKGFSPLFKPDTPEDYKPIVRRNLASRFEFLDRRLARCEFLLGDQICVADFYAYVMGRWARRLEIETPGLENYEAWWARIDKRPAVREAIAVENTAQANERAA